MSARRPLLTSLTMLILFAAPVVSQQTPGELLQSALYKQQVEGDLEGAVKILEGLIEDFGQHRDIAARALVQLGRVHETLGSMQAERAYRRVLSDYPDQLAAVAQARTRLTALAVEEATASPATAESNASADPAGLVIRRVWTYLESEFDIAGTASADGRYLTFEDMATGDLMVRDLVTGENRRLTHNEIPRAYDVGDAGISPDGRWVAYNWDNNVDRTTDLRIVGIDGSEPRVLYSHEEVVNIEVDGWSPDGANILVRLDRNDLSRQIGWVSVTDGSVRVLKSLVWPQPYDQRMWLSPDGRFIAYSVGVPDSLHSIRLLATDGSRETPLFEHPGDDHVLGWTPDGGSLLFRSQRSGTEDVWAIRVANGKAQRSPQLVKKNIGRITARGITSRGAFFYTVSVNTRDAYVATLDPGTGNLLAPPRRASHRYVGNTLSPDWSPTGKHLAYYVSNRSGDRIFAIRNVETGEERDLPRAFVASRGGSPHMRWSPDGRSILLVGWDSMGPENRQGVYQLDVETGDVTPIVQGGGGRGQVGQAVWSPDGTVIFYTRRKRRAQSVQIVARDPETSRETELHGAAGLTTIGPGLAISPDGRYLAFTSSWSGTGAKAVSVVPTAGGEPRELHSVQGPESINEKVVAWTPDGRYVVFGKQTQIKDDTQGSTTRFWRVPAAGGEAEALGLAIEDPLDLRFHPDGRRIAFTSRVDIDEIWVMENFLSPDASGNE